MSCAPLQGKVALVTGGSKGIGAAVAHRLGQSGARVALTFDRSTEAADVVAKEITQDGGDALAIHADSGSPGEIATVIRQVAETFGRIDFLVNNAALGTPGRIDQIDIDGFDRMVAVNLRGVFVAIRETVPHMPKGGRIINIGSISSDHMPMAGNAIYAMTKAGIQGLTKGLARELAERDITINNVEPGRIDTGMLREVLKDRYEEEQSGSPFGRFGTPDDVAALVEYLCGAQAGYITGADLRVDGGVSIG